MRNRGFSVVLDKLTEEEKLKREQELQEALEEEANNDNKEMQEI